MHPFRFPLALAALVSTLAMAGPVPGPSNGPGMRPAAKVEAPESLRLAPSAAEAVRIELEAPPPEAFEALKRANSASGLKRLEIGIGREVGAAQAGTSPAWRATANGLAAHWQVTSRTARALRIAVAIDRLPANAELRFVGIDSPVVYGPVTASEVLATGGVYWSPVLEGESGRVEVFVPAGANPAQAAIDIPLVSHLFASPSDPKAEQLLKAAQACEVNFVCLGANDSNLSQTGRSVARMTFTGSSGGTGLCTGTLLNPSDGSFTPYFYSAAHCISTQSVASSLTTHWFYESTTCSGNALSPSYVQVGGGATMLYASTSSDAFFARLNSNPPAAAIYAGWDAATLAAGTPVTAIHHPDGDLKKVSLGSIFGFGPATGLSASGDFIRVNWNSTTTGVTEGGSSGSGIFSGNSGAGYRFRGGLLGGPSSCTAAASELFDYYSRFDQVYSFISSYLAGSTQPPPPTGQNVISNPGFESGASGWTQGSLASQPVITTDAANAHSGSMFAWLGGYNNASDSVYQDVTVPAGGRLQFWYRIVTSETSSSSSYDFMTVALLNPSTGGTITTLATFSNLNATGGSWAQSTIYDLSAYAGQTVRLRFAATTDGSNVSSFLVDDVSLAGTASASTNYTALWWNSSESGWGLNVNQQGDTAFATLFTYDASGNPMWLVMSGGARQGSTDTFSGALYRTTGPAFNASPFTSIGASNVTQVGTMTIAFSSASSGTLTYTVNGVTVVKSITKQVYGTRAAECASTTSSRSSATNYQDLWWNAAESGWGINVTHQNDTLFATLFTYAAGSGTANAGLWLVMSAGVRQSDGSYLGDLYQTRGPAFNAVPFSGVSVTNVGTMRLRFSSGDTATLTYTVNGASVSKVITRQTFSTPVPLCQS